MVDLLPTTATARSIALQFEPDTDLLAGSFLRLITSPSATATARTIEGTNPTGAVATASGLGAGYSKYYEGLVDESFFNSLNLSIGSGGGQIDGNAVASAFASGRGDTSADAFATNIGLANLSYLDRYGGALLIGSTATPFTSSATAGSGSVLGPVAGSSPTSTLNATAIVRGLEGSGVALSERNPRPGGIPLTDAEITGAQQPPGPLTGPLVVSGANNTPLFDFSGTGGLAKANLELSRSAKAANSVGFYRVIDTDGTVRTAEGVLFKPGDAGYAAAALAPDNLVTELQNLSVPSNGTTTTRPIYIDETGYIAPFATLQSPGSEGVQVFGFNDAGTFNNFLALSGNTVLLEDLKPPFSNPKEPDYNDLTTGITQAFKQSLPILDFRNSDGPYQTTFTLQRKAQDSAVLGYYRVLDVDGSVQAADGRILLPGAPDYNKEALRPENLVSELQGLTVPVNQQTIQIPVKIDETSLIVPFARITPSPSSGGDPFNLFSYPSANQDAISHLLSTGQLSYTLEDLLLSDPRRDVTKEPDNNDLSVKIGSFSPVTVPAFSFYGQPNAVVEARAQLVGVDGLDVKGQATADAKGIDNYLIKAVPFGNGDGTATITGDATARLGVSGTFGAGSDPISLNGQAIGIDRSLIFGAPTLNTTVTGRALALTDVGDGAGMQLEQLRGIGISNSLVFTNQGNDVVRGFAGITGGDLAMAPTAAASMRDTAGIDATGMYTGLGNDIIFGKILNEVEADVDADGDGILEDGVFLDHSAVDGTTGGFDGIRNSTANTGIGNDLIAGSSNGSHFNAEIGNDSIDLDRAKSSSLWGGIGNDLVRVKGPSQNNVLWGGLGNDAMQVGSGDGSVLDGGFGQDVATGGTGRDRFIFSEGGAALLASSSSSLGEELADLPLWASLSQDQKNTLWDTGQLVNTAGTQLLGQLDTVRNFQAGNGGDVLEISNSLASVTQKLWLDKGAIFGVDSTGKLSVQEASADGSNRLGVVVGSLADIHKMGMGSPSIAYATDTRQLMFDADGNWSQGSISLGTVNVASGTLNKSNFAFGSTTGNGLGEAPTAQGGVG